MALPGSQLAQAWHDAQTSVEECKEELLHARSMKNGPRIAECRKWLAEAKQHERDAYRRLHSVKVGRRRKVPTNAT
jgi:hypothetical protein